MTAKKTTTKKTATKDCDLSQINLHQRLNLVRGDINQPIVKETMVNNQYSAVTHDQVTAGVRDLLIKYRISTCHSQVEYARDGNMGILKGQTIYVNIDKPDDRETFVWFADAVDRSDKASGKALSYGIKNHTLKMFGILSGDEDEVDHFNEEHKPAKPVQKTINF